MTVRFTHLPLNDNVSATARFDQNKHLLGRALTKAPLLRDLDAGFSQLQINSPPEIIRIVGGQTAMMTEGVAAINSSGAAQVVVTQDFNLAHDRTSDVFKGQKLPQCPRFRPVCIDNEVTVDTVSFGSPHSALVPAKLALPFDRILVCDPSCARRDLQRRCATSRSRRHGVARFGLKL